MEGTQSRSYNDNSGGRSNVAFGSPSPSTQTRAPLSQKRRVTPNLPFKKVPKVIAPRSPSPPPIYDDDDPGMEFEPIDLPWEDEEPKKKTPSSHGNSIQPNNKVHIHIHIHVQGCYSYHTIICVWFTEAC